MNRSASNAHITDAAERLNAAAAVKRHGAANTRKLNYSGNWPAWKLTILMAVMIFVFESIDMAVLHALKIESPWIETLVDAIFLLLMLTPALYFLVFKPLVSHIQLQEETDFTQSAYQRILRISNTSQDLDQLLKSYAEELKQLTQCEIVTIRVIDWLGHVKFESAETSECLLNQESPKCMTETLQAGFCIQIMKELEDRLSDYKTEMGSLHCPEMTRMLSTLPKEKVREIVAQCPLDRFETLVLVPMKEKGVRLGFIQLADTRPNVIHPTAINVVEKSSLQVATAIQRLRAEDGLRQTKNWLENRVQERTAMLTDANNQLNQEILEQKRLYGAIEVYKDKLQSLSKQVLEEEQQGRKQIATELHDRIGHSLALVKIKLGMIANQVGTADPKGQLDQIRTLINQTISDTRTLTFELSPPVLYEIGLESALEWLVQNMEQSHDIRVELVSRGGEGRLSENQRFVIFRAARELLFNVIKHANAGKAMVVIRNDNGEFALDVEDNGVGFNDTMDNASSYESSSFGLFGIRERLGYLGGKLEIANRQNGGARVTLRVPVAKTAEPPVETKV